MKEEYLNKLSKEIHENNVKVGWWPEGACIYEKLQLVSTEISEATEGARKNLMDDHLPQYKMERVELADALIRLLDIGGRYKLNYRNLGLEFPFIGSDKSVGSNHLGINVEVVNLAKALYVKKGKEVIEDFYSSAIDAVLLCSKARGFNLAAPLVEKLEYNKNRLDHKLESRGKDGGKKF